MKNKNNMEKDYNLQCIDYAVAKTMERAKDDPQLKELATNKHLTNAIIEYMFNGNAKGFSSKDSGRSYILQLRKEDFEEQLLKHVVKAKNAKTKLGLVQQLSFNKNFGDSLTDDDVQELLYKSYGEMDMNGIKYLLDKYPTLYRALASNFIEERYFNSKLGEDQLDKEMSNYQNNFYYNKINEFYGELKKENAIQK